MPTPDRPRFDPDQPVAAAIAARRFPTALPAATLLQPGVLDGLPAGLDAVHVDFGSLGPVGARAHVLALTDLVQRLRARGVRVSGRFTLGLDHDDVGSFERLVAWVEDQGLAEVELRLRTPEPGSAEVRELASVDRIVHRDWRAWDGAHVVVEPARMSAVTLYRGWAWCGQVLDSWPSRWRRRPRELTALPGFLLRQLDALVVRGARAWVGRWRWRVRNWLGQLGQIGSSRPRRPFVPRATGRAASLHPEPSGALALGGPAVYFEPR